MEKKFNEEKFRKSTKTIFDSIIEKEFNEKIVKRRLEDIYNSLIEVLVKKQYDYGESFKKNWKRYGPIYVSTRLDEKMDRLRNLLITGEKPKNETVHETFNDIIGYSLLSILELKKFKWRNKK
jgi:hypothetical protein